MNLPDLVNQRLAAIPDKRVAREVRTVLEMLTHGVKQQGTPAAKTTSTTLTAAELLGGIITGNQGAGAAATYTLPTAAALEQALKAAYPALRVNDSIEFSLINLSTVAAEDATIATATGWTLVGEMTVESNDADRAASSGRFLARRTAADTWTLYRIA